MDRTPTAFRRPLRSRARKHEFSKSCASDSSDPCGRTESSASFPDVLTFGAAPSMTNPDVSQSLATPPPSNTAAAVAPTSFRGGLAPAGPTLNLEHQSTLTDFPLPYPWQPPYGHTILHTVYCRALLGARRTRAEGGEHRARPMSTRSHGGCAPSGLARLRAVCSRPVRGSTAGYTEATAPPLPAISCVSLGLRPAVGDTGSPPASASSRQVHNACPPGAAAGLSSTCSSSRPSRRASTPATTRTASAVIQQGFTRPFSEVIRVHTQLVLPCGASFP